MTIKQLQVFNLSSLQSEIINEDANLVLGFGSKALIGDENIIQKLSTLYPNAIRAYCSSAGEIYNDDVLDDSISVVIITFKDTILKANGIDINAFTNSFDAGISLVTALETDNLKYIMVLSDGAKVNGSELVKGMTSIIPDHIPITGGLAGDGARFENTLVGLNEMPINGRVLAIGFYGDNLRVSHSSLGGWESFGLERVVTKSTANVLFEIDGKNALELYKDYLGKYADELPGSALLFPLSVKINDAGDALVRTILSIDTDTQSMVFAGDVPQGSKVRFMRANFDRLIDAASNAAQMSLTAVDAINPQLAILISCVGRKLILANRIDEEVEAVKEILGPDTVISGFYSYGELSPLDVGSGCKLHNQTMTITCFEELVD